jgi:hypothetical protein
MPSKASSRSLALVGLAAGVLTILVILLVLR